MIDLNKETLNSLGVSLSETHPPTRRPTVIHLNMIQVGLEREAEQRKYLFIIQ